MHRAADVAGSAPPRAARAATTRATALDFGQTARARARGGDSRRREAAPPHALLSFHRTCHVSGLIKAVANNERLLYVAERARKQARPRIRGGSAIGAVARCHVSRGAFLRPSRSARRMRLLHGPGLNAAGGALRLAPLSRPGARRTAGRSLARGSSGAAAVLYAHCYFLRAPSAERRTPRRERSRSARSRLRTDGSLAGVSLLSQSEPKVRP